MRVRNFQSQLWLPQSRDKVFAFFSDAQNLDLITPPWLHFRTLTRGSGEMRPGMLMDHRLRLHGFPLRWRSKITGWEPSARFVDERSAVRTGYGFTSIDSKSGITARSCAITFVMPCSSIF